MTSLSPSGNRPWRWRSGGAPFGRRRPAGRFAGEVGVGARRRRWGGGVQAHDKPCRFEALRMMKAKVALSLRRFNEAAAECRGRWLPGKSLGLRTRERPWRALLRRRPCRWRRPYPTASRCPRSPLPQRLASASGAGRCSSTRARARSRRPQSASPSVTRRRQAVLSMVATAIYVFQWTGGTGPRVANEGSRCVIQPRGA